MQRLFLRQAVAHMEIQHIVMTERVIANMETRFTEVMVQVIALTAILFTATTDKVGLHMGTQHMEATAQVIVNTATQYTEVMEAPTVLTETQHMAVEIHTALAPHILLKIL